MHIHDDLHLNDDWEGDEQTCRLNVLEMIGLLRVIEANMRGDVCLEDLIGELSAVCEELAERRKLAVQVADEVDASNCVRPN